MLSQLMSLSQSTDGRYASDEELEFLSDYYQSFNLRLQTYQKLQSIESTIVQEVLEKIRYIDPALLRSGREDMTTKWKRDTIRVLRYSAIAMLLNDQKTLRERLLFWMQTIMRAFGAQKSCKVTYQVMQEVVKQHLTATQAGLFCPILEVNANLLGQ